MNAIKKILIERDGMTSHEAEDLLLALGMEVHAGADPEEILIDDLGLEPDYIFDLMEYV